MHPENLLYRLYGVKKEYPDTNPLALGALIGISNIYGYLTRLQVNGYIPDDGPVLFIANHTSIKDTFATFYTTVHATRDEAGQLTLGRTVRAAAKSTLFGVSESEEVREGTGKNGLLNSDHPLAKAIVRSFIGWTLRGAGFIPIRRGMADRQALREINKTLREYRQPAAISLIESRVKSGRLERLKTGAAFVLRMNPDVPYCLVGFSSNPNAITLGKPATYSKLIGERGELDLNGVTMILADGIVDLLPERIQEHWRTEGRAVEYNKLYGINTEAVIT